MPASTRSAGNAEKRFKIILPKKNVTSARLVDYVHESLQILRTYEKKIAIL